MKRQKKSSSDLNSNIDILNIYDSVIQELEYHNRYIEEYKIEYKELKNKKPINYKERQEIEHKLFWLNKKINLSLDDYKDKIEETIKGYNLLKQKQITISFVKTNKTVDQNKELNNIIKNFIKITKQYSDQINHYLNYTKGETTSKNICNMCNSINLYITNRETICIDCGNEFESSMPIEEISYDDSERVNMTVKFKYSRIAHFEDTIEQFQGKQNKTIPLKVFLDLEKEFEIQNLLNKRDHKIYSSGKEFHDIIDKDEVLRSKIFNKITRENIINILSETSNSKYYEDVNLIHKYYNPYNFKNDISHLEDVLIEDFTKILDVYEVVHKNLKLNRINFLNSNYILFQLLRKHNYPCSKDNFMFLKTIDRIIEHDIIYEKICELLEWTFIPTY